MKDEYFDALKNNDFISYSYNLKRFCLLYSHLIGKFRGIDKQLKIWMNDKESLPAIEWFLQNKKQICEELIELNELINQVPLEIITDELRCIHKDILDSMTLIEVKGQIEKLRCSLKIEEDAYLKNLEVKDPFDQSSEAESLEIYFEYKKKSSGKYFEGDIYSGSVIRNIVTLAKLYFYQIGDWIYYYNLTNNAIHRFLMKEEIDEIVVPDVNVERILLNNGKLYFIGKRYLFSDYYVTINSEKHFKYNDGSHNCLFEIRCDGTLIELADMVSLVTFDDKYLYVLKNDKYIYRYDKQGRGSLRLIELNNDCWGINLQAFDGWLYWCEWKATSANVMRIDSKSESLLRSEWIASDVQQFNYFVTVEGLIYQRGRNWDLERFFENGFKKKVTIGRGDWIYPNDFIIDDSFYYEISTSERAIFDFKNGMNKCVKKMSFPKLFAIIDNCVLCVEKLNRSVYLLDLETGAERRITSSYHEDLILAAIKWGI